MAVTVVGFQPPAVGATVHHVVPAPPGSERSSACREDAVSEVGTGVDDIFVVLDSGERSSYRTPEHFGYWGDDQLPGHCVGTWHYPEAEGNR